MSYATTFLNHAKSLQAAATQAGVTATLQMADFGLRLQLGDAVHAWAPKFMARAGRRLVYTHQMGPGTVGFAGWMPHGPRRWPIALDKAAFKHYALGHGMATPPACRDPQRIGGPFLVKKVDSSFGEGMRGPFLAHDASDPAHRLGEGEYYENFIPGLIAKAWCWGSECVAVELHAPTVVTGDGCASLRELVLRLPDSAGGEHDWELIGALARYCGVASPDAVLREGAEVLVEYRYGSRYDPRAPANRNAYPRLRGTPLAARFAAAAATFSRAIAPGSDADATFYTLDAIVDAQGEAWFLEMNCSPMVHPDLYPVAVGALVAQHRAARANAQPAAA